MVKRNIIAISYTLAVTFAVGKWAIHTAYLERGHESIGGEFCLIFMVYWAAWFAINFLLNTLEEFGHGRKHKARSRRPAGRKVI